MSAKTTRQSARGFMVFLLRQTKGGGKRVTGSQQFSSARAIDGSLHFWIGRSKTPRRTDIAPAIRFDVVAWK